MFAGKQRAQERLKTAIAAEIDNAAIRDEKEEWALVFARAVREDEKAASARQRPIKGRNPSPPGVDGGEAEPGGGVEGGAGVAADPRPTPLVALRLLREAQEERSLSVKVTVSSSVVVAGGRSLLLV